MQLNRLFVRAWDLHTQLYLSSPISLTILRRVEFDSITEWRISIVFRLVNDVMSNHTMHMYGNTCACIIPNSSPENPFILLSLRTEKCVRYLFVNLHHQAKQSGITPDIPVPTSFFTYDSIDRIVFRYSGNVAVLSCNAHS